jgi:chromosome segregation ATPase
MKTNFFTVVTGLQLIAVAGYAQSSPQFFTAPAPAPLVMAMNAAPVTATVISSSKDWRLLDMGSSCVAETAVAIDGVTHHLEVRVTKVASSPLEMTIRAEAASTPVMGYKAALDRAKTKVYTFAKLSNLAGEEVFWNIPRGSEDLVSYLKRENKFEVQATDSSGLPGKTAVFSLRGSSATISDLGKKCAAGLSVPTPADSAFEKAFLPQSVASVDLARVTPAKADALRSFLTNARLAFLDSAATQSEIERLNAQYLREINELAGLRRNLDRLTQQEVKRLETERANAQVAIATASQEIQTLKPQVGTIEGQLVTANAEYETAYNAIKPHLSEYNRLVQVVRTQESREDDAQSRLSQAESRLGESQVALRDLENEARSLRLSYSSAQSEAQSARTEYQRDGQELRRFDRNRELRDRLARDGRIDSIERELQQFDARIRAQQQALANQEAERNRLNAELQACKQTAGRDCSAEQQALVNAQRRFQEIRQGIAQLEQNRASKQSEIASIRRQIESEVDRMQNDLERREAASRQRLNNAEMRLREIESRLRSIEQVEIPSRENDIRRLESDRSSASTDLSDATRRLRQARQDLSSFKASVGFDALQAEVDRKLARVNALKSDLAKVDREIKRREKIIADGQRTLAQVAVEMERVLEQIKLKEARSGEVQRALEPYELEKKALDAKKLASDQAFAANQAQFASNL